MNKMMQRIANEMQQDTGAFSISNSSQQPMILDMCCAPGTYLQYALRTNPGAGALGFSLPYEQGGHKLIVKTSETVKIKFLDVTLLAADMGVAQSDIPPDHPHAQEFHATARLIPPGTTFDLVLCDGQVLRTHQPYRSEYRERREARRLTTTQLALGLGHLAPGGTMVVLLHRLEAWDTILLLHTFMRFSTVRLFKPRTGHAKRSSFYMVAKDVQSRDTEATAAVEQWKEDWRTATLVTDDQRWRQVRRQIGAEIPDVDAFLHEFGPELAELGREVWAIQADALERAPFMVKE
jgi:23S rRNA U2552 (ribose-2'-O)-methylase RlmE/FtsJ